MYAAGSFFDFVAAFFRQKAARSTAARTKATVSKRMDDPLESFLALKISLCPFSGSSLSAYQYHFISIRSVVLASTYDRQTDGITFVLIILVRIDV